MATVSGDFSWGEPGGSPTIIARLNGRSGHPCLYAYEAGAAMTTGTAPARRVHSVPAKRDVLRVAQCRRVASSSTLPVGWGWVRRRFQAGSRPARCSQGGQIRLEWVGGGTLQTATKVPGPWSDVFGAFSPYLAPTTNSAQFFRVKQ